MKRIVGLLVLIGFIWSCSGTKSKSTLAENPRVANDTVRIANDEIEYEIIVIEPGFNSWLASRAMPRNYYSQSYLEARNQVWVMEFNSRVLQPMRFDPNLYMMTIDYQRGIDYGYEVNYLLYYYLVYFQLNYNQKLGGFPARI